eukprot:jgi/Astpho2/6449/Aster-08294
MYHYWLQCCKCSKKWIDQEGPGSHTGYPGSKASTVAMREAQPNSAGSEEYKREVYHELIAEWKAE